MATIDYGAIVVRDGKFVNRDVMFMEKTDLGCDLPECEDGYACVGDANFMVSFYQSKVSIIINGEEARNIWIGACDGYSDNHSKAFYTKLPYEKMFNVCGSGVDISFECIDRQRRIDPFGYKYYSDKFLVSFSYKGHEYRVYTGYGIDTKEDVYERIKYDHYGYSDIERSVIDKVFKEG